MKLFVMLAAMFIGFSANASLESYAGMYSGKFEGHKGMIHVEVSGGSMSVMFMGADGTDDILGNGCGSTIGKLLDLDMDGNEVDHATFAFNPGSCTDVEGREIVLDFGHKDGVPTKVSASVYARTETQWVNQCHTDPHGGMHCWQTPESVPVYDSGSFRR